MLNSGTKTSEVQNYLLPCLYIAVPHNTIYTIQHRTRKLHDDSMRILPPTNTPFYARNLPVKNI